MGLSRHQNHVAVIVAVTQLSTKRKRESDKRRKKKKLQGFSGAVLSRDEMPSHITSLCVAIMPHRKIHTGAERGEGLAVP